MMDAFFDTHNCEVVDVEVVRAICAELGADAKEDFDLIPLYKGGGTSGIATECRLCGAPLGSKDPDDCKWVMLGVCSDCKQP